MMNERDEELLAPFLAKTKYTDTTYHNLLFDLVKEKRPKTILEVGVRFGSSLMAMRLAADRNCVICGVDIDFVTLQQTKDAFKKAGELALLVCERDVDALSYMHADFVHLDSVHNTEGLTIQLYLVTGWTEPPKTIVVHDWIDDRVRFACTELDGYTRTVHEEVFNGCVVYERIED